MDKIINSPYNINAVARVDSDNIVHNHIYHHCPIGRVDNNNNVVGRVDDDGIVHNHSINNSPIGKVLENGFVIKENALVGRVDGDNLLLAGAAYLLLIQGNR